MQIKKTTFIQKFRRIKYLLLEIHVPCVYLLYFTDLHLFLKDLYITKGFLNILYIT